MRATRAAAATGALMLALAGCAGTGSDKAITEPVSNRPNAQDRTWVTKTHQGNLAEIAAGKLAERRGADKAVRSMGGTLISDHKGSDTQLRRTASKLGLSMPLGPDAEQRAVGDRLAHESGKKFDRDFIKSMTAAHKTAIAQTTTEINQGDDAAVRTLADKAMPVLKKHLWMLQHIQP